SRSGGAPRERLGSSRGRPQPPGSTWAAYVDGTRWRHLNQKNATAPARHGSHVAANRYAATASRAWALVAPATVSTPAMPASTKPSPPGVIGIMPATFDTMNAASAAAGFTWAPTARNAK